MKLKESLPARVALLTGGMLAVILVVLTGASYVITATLLRQGVDAAMMAALPTAAGGVRELVEQTRRFRPDGIEHRRVEVQVLDATGQVVSGNPSLPVDPDTVATALEGGHAFVSLHGDDGNIQPRQGPDWWQALTPQEDELRVLYARVGPRDQPLILQLAESLGPVSEALPALFSRLLLVALVGVAITGFVVWRMAAETYRPLKAVIATADDVTTKTLSTRIPDKWHDRTLHHLISVLNAMIGRLQEAFDTQGRFVAAAAHELRGPLAAMRTDLEVTLRRQRTAEEYRAALEGSLAETDRLTTLAEHLLTLARYERGLTASLVRDLELTPLLEEAAADVRRSDGGEITVSAPDDLRLDADPIALQRVVANLVRNAIQAGGSPVRVEAAEDADGITIAVSDQGPGIPAEALPHLFEPFYRADQARSRDGGTGLGLAIVRTVVDAHRGKVTVASEPGHGARFTVWFPRHQP